MAIKCSKCQFENTSDSDFCKQCGAELLPLEEIPVCTKTLQTPMRGAINDVDVGETIDEKYKLIEELGSGGMGVVYKAEQLKPIKRSVAIKIIKLGMDTKEVVARFEAEKQALAVMKHPNISKVIDAGATETGRPYFVMELVSGIPITEYCDKHKLTTKERLELFIPVCEAVQHAHQKGVIHRDLKPSNVLVEIQENNPVPKIIDFGIAKATEHRLAERTIFTERGQLIGTPEYMSPEQAEMSELDVDTRTDIYSLGVMLYELLVGALPFDPEVLRSAGFGEIQRIIREVDPPKASTRLSQLGDAEHSIAEQRQTDSASLYRQLKGDLDWILMTAMEKDRVRRYETASGLAMDLKRYFGNEPVHARPPSTSYRIAKFARRHKLGLAAGLMVVAALVLGLALATTGMLRARRAEAIATTERDRANQEAETAKQVSDFLIELFEVSDPERLDSSEKWGNTITAREILDRGLENIETKLADQPEIQATLMTILGEVYDSLGLYDETIPLFEKALKIRKQLYGNEHLDVCHSLSNLAYALITKADYERAEALLREAIEIHRKLQADHKEFALLLNNLANVFLGRYDFDAAEPLLQEALDIQREFLDEEDPNLAHTLHNLASVLLQRGDYPGAEELYREALELRRKLLGDIHPHVATCMDMLARTLHNQGEYEEAELLFRDALSIRRELLGDEHPDVALTLNNLALLLGAKEDYEEAETMARESLAIYQKVWGNNHPNVAISLNCLAKQLQGQEKFEESERCFLEALAIFHEVLGKEHPYVAFVLNNMAEMLMDKQDYAKAEPLIREALAMRQKLLGNNHSNVADSLYDLATVLFRKEDYEEAEALYYKSLEIRQKVLPEGHLRIIQTSRDLGNCLTKLRRFEEAEKLLLESHRLLESKDEKNDKEITKALNYIIDHYEARGTPEMAAEYRALLKENEIKK